MKTLVFFILLISASYVGSEQRWEFEGLTNGELPENWKIESTGPDVPLAEWKSEQDASAPAGPNILRLINPHHNINQGFNICWTESVTLCEGELSVWLKGNTGKRDQGGGVIWRTQNKNNYYIARYNPLEQNVSIYYTLHGKRIMLGYSGTLIAKEGWNLLRISHTGGAIRVYLNGAMAIMVNDGGHILDAGGVGIWTKSDAATSFDGFTVIPK